MKILAVEDFENRVKTFRKLLIGFPVDLVHLEHYEGLTDVSDYDVLMLDHDLHGESFVDPKANQDNGTVFVNAMRDGLVKTKPNVLIIVHSHNNDRNLYMTNTLRAAGYNAYSIPYYIFKSLVKQGNIYDAAELTDDGTQKVMIDTIFDLSFKLLQNEEKQQKFVWLTQMIKSICKAANRVEEQTKLEKSTSLTN